MPRHYYWLNIYILIVNDSLCTRYSLYQEHANTCMLIQSDNHADRSREHKRVLTSTIKNTCDVAVDVMMCSLGESVYTVDSESCFWLTWVVLNVPLCVSCCWCVADYEMLFDLSFFAPFWVHYRHSCAWFSVDFWVASETDKPAHMASTNYATVKGTQTTISSPYRCLMWTLTETLDWYLHDFKQWTAAWLAEWIICVMSKCALKNKRNMCSVRFYRVYFV